MSNLLRSLIVRVGADLSEFQKEMKYLSKDLKKAGKEITAAGSTLTKGLTMPIVGAVAGLTGLAVSAGKNADELLTLSAKTGIATQALQEMEYAARFIDVEVETMTGSMAKLTKSMDGARDGTGEQAEAFKKLGIQITNSDGSLRNAKEVWAESIDALGGISSEADRDALSMQLFGKSAMELNPLIKAGSDELLRLGQEAHTVGAVMSDESVTALGKFDDQMEKLKAVVQTAGGEIGAAFLPLLEKFMPIIEEQIVPAIKNFAGRISDVIDKFTNLSPEMQGFILALLAVIVGIGPVLSILGPFITLISGVVGAFAAAAGVITAGGGFIAAMGALLGPVGIVLIIIAALAAAAYLVISNWEPLSNFFVNLFDSIVSGIGSAIDWIKALPGQALSWGRDMIDGFVQGVKDKMYAVVDAVKGVANSISNFLHFSTPDIGPLSKYEKWMPDFMSGLAKGIRDNKYLVENAIAGLSGDMGLNVNAGLVENTTAANITVISPTYLDGRVITSATSKIQYGRNQTRSRSLGVAT